MKKFFLSLLLVMSSVVETSAQTKQIDSLKALLKTAKEDTNKVNVLNELSRKLVYIGNYDTSFLYATNARDVASTLGFKKGIANAYNIIGVVNKEQGNLPEALKNYFSALKIFEEIEDKNGIATSYGNMGLFYVEQKNYAKALDYYFKVLKIAENLRDTNKIAITFGNIGIVYDEQKDYVKALDYYFKALKIDEELENKNGIARHLGNIGVVYKDKGDYLKARDYYLKALKITEDLRDKSGITNILGNIGGLYILTNNYPEAEKYLLKSLLTANEIGSLDDIEICNQNLSELYTRTCDYKKALEHYKDAMAAKDSLLNADKNEEIIRMEMNYEFDKKEVLAKANQEKKDLKKDMIMGFTVLGLIIVVMFLLFAFRSLRVTTKQVLLIIGNFFKLFVTRPFTKKREFGK